MNCCATCYDQALGTYISLTNFLNLAHTFSLVKLYTALNNDHIDGLHRVQYKGTKETEPLQCIKIAKDQLYFRCTEESERGECALYFTRLLGGIRTPI